VTRDGCPRCSGYDPRCLRCEARRLARKHGANDGRAGEGVRERDVEVRATAGSPRPEGGTE
jgi:hypothetical protein